MKKKLVLLFIFTMFLGMGNVLAEYKCSGHADWYKCNADACSCEINGGGFDGMASTFYYARLRNRKTNTEDIAYCIDATREFYGPGKTLQNDAVSYWYTYRPVTYDYSISDYSTMPSFENRRKSKNDVKEFIKHMGVYKYYLEKENPYNGSTFGSNSMRYYVQKAIWWLVAREYGIVEGTTQNYTWSNGFKNYIQGAENFYNQHKDEFEVSAQIWTSNGQPIMTLNAERIFKYDYSLDVACTNCDSTISDSKAYVIQDTTNWEAIMKSDTIPEEVRCPQIPTKYYTNDKQTYCREEYHIYYPNQTNNINITLGRYFTLNIKSGSINNNVLDISTVIGMPNFRPVKVKRVRECRNVNGRAGLNNYNSDATFNDFVNGCTGDIYIKYEESKYGLDKTKLERYSSPDSTKREFIDNNQTLRYEVTYSYTLPTNVFRYQRSADGKAVSAIPDARDSFGYTDLGVGILPISYGNNDGNHNDVYLRFSYELPEKSCSGSSIKEFDNYNTTDQCKNTENIISKYRKGTASDAEIMSSACGKLYESEEGSDRLSSAKTCLDDMSKNANKCSSMGELNNNNSYICSLNDVCETQEDAERQGRAWDPIHVVCCPPMEKYDEVAEECKRIACDSEQNAGKLGRSWNYAKNECCPIGEVYNPKTQDCDDPKGNICDSEEESIKRGLSWNPKGEFCCPSGTVYNPITEKCEDTDDDSECKSKEDAERLGVAWNAKHGYCCKPMEKYDEVTGKCEPSGVYDLAYRIVSLDNPFVGETGAVRKTGNNWCYYDGGEGKYVCSGDRTQNKLVNMVIPKQTVYSDDHILYQITLDSDSINKIRKYNKDHDYDDWDLNCSEVYAGTERYTGGACISEFLKTSSNFKSITGKCSNGSLSEFYTCDDFGGGN